MTHADVEFQAEIGQIELLEAIADGACVLDLAGRVTSMNAAGRTSLGIASDAPIQGRTWTDFWSDEVREEAHVAAGAARAGRRGRFTAASTAEGDERWWDVAVTPMLGTGARPERLLAVWRDYTPTLDAQREFAESEERYRLLSESLPGTTWMATPDGMIDHISEGPSPAPRRPTTDRMRDAWLDMLHPDDRERIAAAFRTSMETGALYDVQGRLRMADGTYRWQLARGVPQRADDGRIVRWVGLTVDIDDQRRADEARDMFVALADKSSDLIAITDPDGKVIYANPAARTLLSLDERRSDHFLAYFSPEDQEFVKSVVIPAIETQGRWVGKFQMRNFKTGAVVPILYNTFKLTNARGENIGLATISQDLRERRRIDAGLRALADAGAAMYDSLDYEDTLRNIADAVAKTFATACTIDVLDEAGNFRRVAIAHPRPEMHAIFAEFTDQRRFAPRHPVFEAIRLGTSTCVTDVDREWSLTQVASTVAATEALGIRSFMTVPVRTPDGSVLGALTCSLDRDDPRPSYVPDDLRFAEELGRRAGIAVQHARAYQRERTIAVRFQEASLPTALPNVEGVSLSADYRPGNSEATVGGDWYDAFLLKDGRLVVTIGDVLGKGLDAAVTMAKLRQAMRSAAALLPEPNALLTAAESTVRDVSPETYATAMAGIYDPRCHLFTFASAGHPGPTLRRPNGDVEDHTARGVMLGLRDVDATQTVSIWVPAGSALIFFTDGLTEATRDIAQGYHRLHAAIAAPALMTVRDPARAIVDGVLGGRPTTDDIAVLVARIHTQH